MEDVSILQPGYVLRPAWAIQAADTLIRMKKDNRPIWESIEYMIKVWHKTRPTEWKSYLYYLNDIRETRIDKKFGTSKTKGSNLRYTLDIPEIIMSMIRKLYTADELPMDRKFFIKFARRFPAFKVVEKM